jgi:hypothetical protein
MVEAGICKCAPPRIVVVFDNFVEGLSHLTYCSFANIQYFIAFLAFIVFKLERRGSATLLSSLWVVHVLRSDQSTPRWGECGVRQGKSKN